MREQTEIDYYRTRERKERMAIEVAGSPAARDAHFVLAERYADRAWSLGEELINPRWAA